MPLQDVDQRLRGLEMSFEGWAAKAQRMKMLQGFINM